LKLFSRVLGQGQPMLIIHGLFGMSDNWQALGKEFSDFFEVHLIDQRNHGRSPHAEAFSYAEMSMDLSEYILDRHLKDVIIIGHSLGGKTAMKLAINEPQLIQKLVVVDISPRYYAVHHHKIIEGLQSLNLTHLNSRSQADQILSQYIVENDVRQFLLKSIYWKEKGLLDYRFNLKSIAENIENVGEPLPPNTKFNKSSLFLKGQLSNYILEEDEDLIFSHFPKAQIETFDQCGHWLHAENPTQFFETVMRFCL